MLLSLLFAEPKKIRHMGAASQSPLVPVRDACFLVTTELPPCQYSTAPKRKGRAGLPRSRVVNCRNELFFNLPTSDNLKPFEEHT
jgi:hypothetical protein